VGLVDARAGGRMSVGEALTNLVWVPIDGFRSIGFSATWQWPCKQPGEDARLYYAVEAVSNLLIKVHLRIFVGKDSVSLVAWTLKNGKPWPIISPGTVQMIAVAPCTDIRKVVTPDIKMPGESRLMLIDLSGGKNRLGGSALAQVHSQIGNKAPDMDYPGLVVNGFEAVQSLIRDGVILSGHDRSDGGLISTFSEMAFGGNCGVDISLSSKKFSAAEMLFSQELGLVIEHLPEDGAHIQDVLDRCGLAGHYHRIGVTSSQARDIVVNFNGRNVLAESTNKLRAVWEQTSHRIARQQSDIQCAKEAEKAVRSRNGMHFSLSFTPERPKITMNRKRPRVAVLNEEGTNGQVELAAALKAAGFMPYNVAMSDLMKGKISLKRFRGIMFPGGFSFKDALGAGVGWARKIQLNPRLKKMFSEFRKRKDTFALGICNGCQVMADLGWLLWKGIPVRKQPRFVRNTSRKFEHNFATLKILPSSLIFFRGMAGSRLGVWVAHGEGRCHWPDKNIMREAVRRGLAPAVYVDDDGSPTEAYPFNPNGSDGGITALSSEDGRFLAMMPHPERGFINWQWGYWPRDWKFEASPWLRMFQNAREWCDGA